MIPFNKPFIIGDELKYIQEAVQSGKISGDGIFTKKCQEYFEKKYSFPKVLMTTSCTDALEMAAILCDIKPGDEVIVPSYTFVSSANAFALRGAKIVFVDSCHDHPNIDPLEIEKHITTKTKVIVPVHYAGVACDMETIMNLANQYELYVVEDAAQAIDSYYTFSDGTKKALGAIGHFAAFSFHETKNIIAGEGGMLVINDEKYFDRAEIIREKGTNRSAFFRGEVNKYGWVDLGSSFLPSEIISAFLYAQIENIDKIQRKRVTIWNVYNDGLRQLAEKGYIQLPKIFDYATNNAHMFYIVCRYLEERTKLIQYMKSKDIHPVFHYLSLNKSDFFLANNPQIDIPNSDHFTDCLLRLPFYYELKTEEQLLIIKEITNFYTDL
ncbi:dTDP-4-amino-4,6-dideoxygalactose transaminase [Elizabethkingia anophelis]|uniref:dTDP-4-amino-4,6-dideoxygalactose transaminase n=1 Tax=Elizabethkingia TaxID=308865 RepID=UPI00077EB024|nr:MULTISPECIES: dTDP-4-amino-4,6-dideoxygalactose transaminase [Elizabethkingia]AMR41652.1 dTDP-4-amino-4,6-dideoxygalactose transaminase [Elizabethkingia anophelis]AMX48291.1 dTDP-4-amino-4,6-dideoxygalactose transaminase [Elizabethkingia anophelis]AMX51751.1 dTDP-4-amino-4,6-dideoxygalactose transaminase [Elizabethkingia anophelis]AMX55140.1 dTDP-4-amino-4,6-dideoxygalactose transaminase [Elizabethkingia anophelis]EGT4348196.1 dTDP-4-amino-4,6-dideoxygalactose transaminase [Elizabethkingia 